MMLPYLQFHHFSTLTNQAKEDGFGASCLGKKQQTVDVVPEEGDQYFSDRFRWLVR